MKVGEGNYRLEDDKRALQDDHKILPIAVSTYTLIYLFLATVSEALCRYYAMNKGHCISAVPSARKLKWAKIDKRVEIGQDRTDHNLRGVLQT